MKIDLYNGSEICEECNPYIVKQGESIALQVRVFGDDGMPVVNLADYSVVVSLRTARVVSLLFEAGDVNAEIPSLVDEDGYIAFVLGRDVTSKLTPEEYWVGLRIEQGGGAVDMLIKKAFTLVCSGHNTHPKPELRPDTGRVMTGAGADRLISISAALDRIIYGKSAYDLAIEHGYKGSEEDYAMEPHEAAQEALEVVAGLREIVNSATIDRIESSNNPNAGVGKNDDVLYFIFEA